MSTPGNPAHDRLGIYTLADGELRLCLAEHGRTERPAGFGTRGTPHTTFFLKRVEE
jgi:hypothetical protein